MNENTPNPASAAPSSIIAGEARPTIRNSEFVISNSAQAVPAAAAFFRRYLPHHCAKTFNPMHEFSFAQYQRQHAQPLPHRTGRRLAIAAPRGAAKSTLHSMLFPIMDILSGRERHQVIISGTMAQAKNRIATIAHELRTNAAIRDAFFGGKAPKLKTTTRSIELGNCRIEAFSAGSEMRGVSHGEYRPTRIILDDVEQSARMSKSHHRKKLLQWYDEVVENLGDNYTHITIVGTILHTDSLLSNLLNRPGFKSELYKSITQWNNRPDLWRQWQKLFTDRSDPDAVDTAQAFFETNKTDMLEDTQVFWPEKEPYVKLQEKLLVLGRAAFFKEKQNTPIKDGDQIFDTTLWTRFISPDGHIQQVRRTLTIEDSLECPSHALECEGHTLECAGHALECAGHACALSEEATPPPSNPSSRSDPTIRNSELVISNSTRSVADLRYYGFLDPAMGKSTSRDGDYAAIVTVAKAPDGALYVWNVWMEKASPLKQVEQIFALHDIYNYEKFGFEANGFQETLSTFIHNEQTRRKNAGSKWRLPIEKCTNTHSKHSRISLLEPHIIAGTIQFQQDLKQEFYVQADEYNGARACHDDGLDALASCVEMIRTSEKSVTQIKTLNRPTIRRIK
jgi:predicted phage terminase large subunit-like protein